MPLLKDPPQVPPPSWIRPPPEQHHAPAHDWQTAVPDTSLFPPPPALFSGFDASPANNATAEEAEAGEAWCARYPLLPPAALPAAALAALRAHDIAPVPPAGFPGRATQLRPGRWSVRTGPGTRDACILGYPPLYSAREHAGAPRTVYYEVRVRAGSSANVALGFAALPYPSFRLPGWHRGSLAVHGDDGHRYVNDRWGGRAFTRPFAAGATYGVGVVLGAGGAGSVFFTRDGRREGGWDMHEETDAERDLGVFGLEGRHDLSCAIGCFEDVDLEVVFDPAGWMYALKE
ncbi:Protein ssh4 [Escovopsis weberi]|uniref:Protein ssh4 n=1 Tax=Escovopsis weberi TaxID=150374 RepID=A0A0N0RT66_ESCWE|nr:Protein ssh4 [Escovopsis weberi]